jgi:hypothetical protein
MNVGQEWQVSSLWTCSKNCDVTWHTTSVFKMKKRKLEEEGRVFQEKSEGM